MTESRTSSAFQNSNPQKTARLSCWYLQHPNKKKLEVRSVQFQYKLAKSLFWWWKREKRLVYLFYHCFSVDAPNKISFYINSEGNFCILWPRGRTDLMGFFVHLFVCFLNLDVYFIYIFLTTLFLLNTWVSAEISAELEFIFGPQMHYKTRQGWDQRCYLLVHSFASVLEDNMANL